MATWKLPASSPWCGTTPPFDDPTDPDTYEDAPAADEVVPDANQYRYQKEELSAFCHFGPNTFNEIEWGEHYGNRHPSEIFTLRQDFDADTDADSPQIDKFDITLTQIAS